VKLTPQQVLDGVVPETDIVGSEVRPEIREGDESAKPLVRVRPLIRFDPDAELAKISRVISTKIVNVDAKIFEGAARSHRWNPHKRQHYRTAEQFFKSPTVVKRLREAYRNEQIKDISDRLQESFTDYADERTTDRNKVFSISDAVPQVAGMAAKQMTLYDVLDAHNKCWDAGTRNPLGKRIVKVISQFVISRGVRGAHTSPEYQRAWNEFWHDQKMRIRLKTLVRELVMYGELFLRYFEQRDGLTIRSLDPSTIWEIVTNPDDIEDVYYYYQQYVTATQLAIALPMDKMPASTLVIRQHPASTVNHIKINATSHEKRGRSELYAILAWLVRFREFANDRIILGKMRAMFALDVAVEGSPEDVTATNEQFAVPPGTGSVLVHNAKIKAQFLQANTNANEAKTDAEMILKIIAAGAGVSESFLGVSYQNTRAGVLVETEPDVKNFEDYREIVEEILHDAAGRVWAANDLDEPETPMEFTFPQIAAENRSATIKDIALAESMNWFSKERSATMVAREFDVTNFDHKAEQEKIQEELGDDPVIAQGMQQVQKVAPDPMELAAAEASMAADAAVGKKPGPVKKATGSGKPAQPTGAASGFPTDTGGRGLSRTRATLDRGKFSRSGEKTSINRNRSSDTSRISEAEVTNSHRSGWTPEARRKSLVTRQRRRAERLLQMAREAEALVNEGGEGAKGLGDEGAGTE
jgi:hypothetical protein